MSPYLKNAAMVFSRETLRFSRKPTLEVKPFNVGQALAEIRQEHTRCRQAELLLIQTVQALNTAWDGELFIEESHQEFLIHLPEPQLQAILKVLNHQVILRLQDDWLKISTPQDAITALKSL